MKDAEVSEGVLLDREWSNIDLQTVCKFKKKDLDINSAPFHSPLDLYNLFLKEKVEGANNYGLQI